MVAINRRSTTPLFRTITWISIVLCTSFLSFYIGIWIGMQTVVSSGSDDRVVHAPTFNNLYSDGDVQQKAEVIAKHMISSQLDDLCKGYNSSTDKDIQQVTSGSSNLFSKSIQHFAQGLLKVSKDDLMSTFDFGVPPNPNTKSYDALILYNKKESLPSNKTISSAAQYKAPTQQSLPHISAKEATENCDTMNVVLTNNPGNTRQCLALVGGQYQSYHIQRWMRRRPDNKGKLDPSMPLKLTSKGYTANGKQEFVPPKEKHVKSHQQKLLTYLTEIDSIKANLRGILKKISKQNTVVVLTCNQGQSELLMNFACSAHARGFDLSNLLVFPTDIETDELAKRMGLTTFYEEKLMASIPKKEAASYGDSVFTNVMFAKVLCVQLVNELGYDLLFQDADVVWYKNPLGYFHDKSLPQFDMYFQDDGSRAERYAPYSANSGFYFVRSNDKTKHFFRQFIYSSDLIDTWNSHQQVMIALLGEHSSVFGLNVKIFSKELEEFPGGVQFHRWKDAMKKLMKGESNAYIFHMSWTQNKDDKVEFFQQMGEWYLKDTCRGNARNIPHDVSLMKECCSIEPIITCHYKDKPSKIPCPDSPRITEVGKPFFKAFTKANSSFW